jgi:hypothetical protein
MWIFYLFFLAGAFLAGAFFTGAFFDTGFLAVFFLVGVVFFLVVFLPFFDFLDLLTGFFSSSSMVGEKVGYL